MERKVEGYVLTEVKHLITEYWPSPDNCFFFNSLASATEYLC